MTELAGTNHALFDRIARGAERPLAVSPYYPDRHAFDLAARLREHLECEVLLEGAPPDAGARCNDKAVVRETAHALGVGLAPGEVVRRSGPPGRVADEVCAAALRHAQDSGILIRGVQGLAGSDTLRQPMPLDLAAIRGWVDARPHQLAFLVDRLLSPVASPNVHLWIDRDGTPCLTGITGQRLTDDLVHVGNTFPHASMQTPNLEQTAMRLAKWVAQTGHRGPLGIDLLETAQGPDGLPSVLLAEVNARYNASSYSAALWEQVGRARSARGRSPLGAWLTMKEVPTRHRSFAALARALGTNLYRGEAGGAIPYHTGLLETGATSLLVVANDLDEAHGLETAIGACL
jgi:hypothetical protein